jgi:hypothetical protein
MDNGTSSNVFLTMLLSPMLPLEAKAWRRKRKKSDKKQVLRAYKVRLYQTYPFCMSLPSSGNR